MTALTAPRHPFVDSALRLARLWCAGRVIDDAPAIQHAVMVARTLLRHLPDVAAEAVAAALVHDAEEFAPQGTDLDAILDRQIAPGVASIVHALAAQHRAMDAGEPPTLGDPIVTVVAGADKIVAFRALMRRAAASGDASQFWRHRTALRALLPYFRSWCDVNAPLLPASMLAEVRSAIAEVTDAMIFASAFPDGHGATKAPWLTQAVRAATQSGLCGERRGPFSGGNL